MKQEFVDLGLPSGTLWATHNAHVGKKYHFTYDEAIERFGDCMPNYCQCKELLNLCKWEWINLFGGKVQGYKIIGPNGNSIFLPASGYFSGTCLYRSSIYGYYWSTMCNDLGAFFLFFSRNGQSLSFNYKFYDFSIRTIKRKGA